MDGKAKTFLEEINAARVKREDAARRILEVIAELRLTWLEFEGVLDQVKEIAYLSTYP